MRTPALKKSPELFHAKLAKIAKGSRRLTLTGQPVRLLTSTGQVPIPCVLCVLCVKQFRAILNSATPKGGRI